MARKSNAATSVDTRQTAALHRVGVKRVAAYGQIAFLGVVVHVLDLQRTASRKLPPPDSFCQPRLSIFLQYFAGMSIRCVSVGIVSDDTDWNGVAADEKSLK